MAEFKSFKLILLIALIVGSSLYSNIFPVKGILTEDTTPLIDTILQYSENRLIDGMDSGWSAVYGSLSCNSNDYVTEPASLTGIPSTGGSEKLRIQKTFTTPLNLLKCNIGFWIKTSGTIPSDFSFYLETYDTSNKVRQWGYYQLGSRLQGSDKGWSHHFIMSTAYRYENAIDMTKISSIVFKFVTTSSSWTISIDDLRAYPNQDLFPNGAVMLTFDGPYDNQYTWAEPKLDEYGYVGVISTARANLYSQPAREQHLSVLYDKGWDICVYARLFDETDPTKHLSPAQIAENTLAEKAWLDSKGFTRSSAFLHCNRHLLDTYLEDLLDDNFHFIKGNHWLASNELVFPSLAFTGSSYTFAQDMAGIEKAAINKDLYIWFNHLSTGSTYTQAQFNALVDRIHELGMEVITYSQLFERYTQYLDAAAPHLSVLFSNGDYSATDDGVVIKFNNADEVLAYWQTRFSEWESTRPRLTVSSPNGGESWTQGTTHSVTWTSTGSVGPYVKIELLKGGALDSVVSPSTENDGAFNWVVPASQALGSNYRARVTSIDYPSVTDSSDADFTIVEPDSLTVSSPNGGESWTQGTTHSVTWTSTGSVGPYVKIELLKGGVVDIVISDSTENDGALIWVVPVSQALGSNYRARVTSIEHPTVTDSSDADFSIVAPASLTVSSPNGGESWTQGTTHSVTWTSTGSVGPYVKIELLKGGALDSVVSPSTENDGAFNWVIPASQALGSNYRARVTSIEYPTVTDSSDADFAVVAASAVFFSDGFESKSFSEWSGTTATSGETAAVTTLPVNHGVYSARFTSDGGESTESSYSYKTIAPQSELYVRQYVYVSQNGATDTNDRFWVVSLDAGTAYEAFAGWYRTSSGLRWFLVIRSGTSSSTIYSTSAPVTGQWYCVEMRWKKGVVDGLGELWVDGVLVCSSYGKNTSAYGDATRLRVGLPTVGNCGATSVYVDCVRASSSYIGLELGDSLTVSSPNGGESWTQGTTHSVSWTSTGSTGEYVKIELLKGGALDSVVSPSTENDGALDWVVPVSQALGSDYKIRVTSIEYPTVTDSSDADFSIVAPASLTVSDDAYIGYEDTTLNIPAPGVLSNDSDPEGDPLTAIKVTDPSYGTVTLNSDGSFTYTPADNYNCPDSFNYKANDGTLDSNVATVTFTINPVNDAPTVANPIPDQEKSEADTYSLSLVGTFNDVDVDDSLTYTATQVGGDQLPSFLIFDTGTVTLYGSPDYASAGYYQIEVTATDQSGALATDTFDITVLNVNRAPELVVTPDQSLYTVDEKPAAALIITVSFSDPDGDAVTVQASQLPAFVMASPSFPGTTSPVTLTIDPGCTDVGLYSIVLTVADNDPADSKSVSKILMIQVNPTNCPGTLALSADNPPLTMDENSVVNYKLVLTDPEGDGIASVTIISQQPDDSLEATAIKNGDDWYISLTADCNDAKQQATQDYTITVEAIDTGLPSGVNSNQLPVTVTVYNINCPPVLDPIGDKMVNEGDVLDFTISASDPDLEDFTLWFTVYDLPSGATFDPFVGRFVWMPGYDQAGTYTIDFVVYDRDPASGLGGLNDFEEITITVNDVAHARTLTVNIEGSGSVTLDPPGGAYDGGSVVELTASADPGWAFSGWSGDLSGSVNPESITMDGDKTVTATFAENPLMPTEPYITPSVGLDGTRFVITDPEGRMQQGDIALFYAEGTDPATGSPANDVVVSPDGTTLIGNVPAGLSINLQHWVSVRIPGLNLPRFQDLAFYTLPPETYITPQSGAPGSFFQIVDPYGRMTPTPEVIFYPAGSNPALGVPATDVVSDGRFLSGYVPASASLDTMHYVSVQIGGVELFRHLPYYVSIEPVPTITPSIAPLGSSFSIYDPMARITPTAVVVFYLERTEPELGVPASIVSISSEGDLLNGIVPPSLERDNQYYVRVLDADGGSPLFNDLACWVKAPFFEVTTYPTSGAPGSWFVIYDPWGRMPSSTAVLFYLEGGDPAFGYAVHDVVVSGDGKTLTGTVPGASQPQTQHYVRVSEYLGGPDCFPDLAFWVGA